MNDKHYGLIYYDIPNGNQNLYVKVRRVLQYTCLPVNLSVCAFDWSLKKMIEDKLIKTGVFSKANIRMIKIDNTSSPEIERDALKQLEDIFRNIRGRLTRTLRRIGDDTYKKEEYLTRTKAKLKKYDNIITLYSFTNKVEGGLSVLKNIISEEYKSIKETNNEVNCAEKEKGAPNAE